MNFVYVCVYPHMTPLLIWTSEDSLKKSGLSLLNVVPNKLIGFAASTFIHWTISLALWSTYY